MKRKIIVGDYTDESTGIRFVEDIRGNIHYIPELETEVVIPPQTEPTILFDLAEEKDKKIKRLERILERMRSENIWLWSKIETAISEKKKKGASSAMNGLEKAVKERRR